MLKRVIEQERVRHYSPSQIFHAMHGAGSSKGAQLHAVHDLVADRKGDEEREDIVTGCVEMVRSAIELVLSMLSECYFYALSECYVLI